MPDLYTIVRWVHVLAGAAWFGEVIMVTFVMVPVIGRLEPANRAAYISAVFPTVFRLASVFAGVALVAGLLLNYMLTGWQNLGAYFSSTRGAAILVGGVLGALLAGFHFLVEGRIEGRVIQLAQMGNGQDQARIEKMLRVIPRVGLVVMLAIFVLMMVGARGV